jgi:hypothetical protein
MFYILVRRWQIFYEPGTWIVEQCLYEDYWITGCDDVQFSREFRRSLLLLSSGSSKDEVAGYSEMFVTIYKITWHHIAEDRNIHSHNTIISNITLLLCFKIIYLVYFLILQKIKWVLRDNLAVCPLISWKQAYLSQKRRPLPDSGSANTFPRQQKRKQQ